MSSDDRHAAHHPQPLGAPIYIAFGLFLALMLAGALFGWKWNNPGTPTYIIIAHHWHIEPRTKTDCPTMAALRAADPRLLEAVMAHRDVVARVLIGRGC